MLFCFPPLFDLFSADRRVGVQHCILFDRGDPAAAVPGQRLDDADGPTGGAGDGHPVVQRIQRDGRVRAKGDSTAARPRGRKSTGVRHGQRHKRVGGKCGSVGCGGIRGASCTNLHCRCIDDHAKRQRRRRRRRRRRHRQQRPAFRRAGNCGREQPNSSEGCPAHFAGARSGFATRASHACGRGAQQELGGWACFFRDRRHHCRHDDNTRCGDAFISHRGQISRPGLEPDSEHQWQRHHSRSRTGEPGRRRGASGAAASRRRGGGAAAPRLRRLCFAFALAFHWQGYSRARHSFRDRASFFFLCFRERCVRPCACECCQSVPSASAFAHRHGAHFRICFRLVRLRLSRSAPLFPIRADIRVAVTALVSTAVFLARTAHLAVGGIGLGRPWRRRSRWHEPVAFVRSWSRRSVHS